MIYNASKHTLETEDGKVIAELSDEVSADQGFEFSDRLNFDVDEEDSACLI